MCAPGGLEAIYWSLDGIFFEPTASTTRLTCTPRVAAPPERVGEAISELPFLVDVGLEVDRRLAPRMESSIAGRKASPFWRTSKAIAADRLGARQRGNVGGELRDPSPRTDSSARTPRDPSPAERSAPGFQRRSGPTERVCGGSEARRSGRDGAGAVSARSLDLQSQRRPSRSAWCGAVRRGGSSLVAEGSGGSALPAGRRVVPFVATGPRRRCGATVDGFPACRCEAGGLRRDRSKA